MVIIDAANHLISFDVGDLHLNYFIDFDISSFTGYLDLNPLTLTEFSVDLLGII